MNHSKPTESDQRQDLSSFFEIELLPPSAMPTALKNWLKPVFKSCGKLLTRALMLDELHRVYLSSKSSKHSECSEESIFSRALKTLEIDWQHFGSSFDQPAVFVSNHPTGLAEAMVLLELLLRRGLRPKVLANDLLAQIPELQKYLIPIDPFETELSARKNIASLKMCIGHLRDGGSLLVFPAGEVSSFHWSKISIQDRPWNDNIRLLAARANRPLVPLFVSGRNSVFFYLFSEMLFRCRYFLLPRELIGKRNTTFRVLEGDPVFNADNIKVIQSKNFSLNKKPTTEPLCSSPPLSQMLQELTNLKPLFEPKSEKRVFVTRRLESPCLFLEISRLRELSFRAAGEGSGRSQDSDRFDDFYDHLFVWDANSNEILGAYRLHQVCSMESLKQGLYSDSLYEFPHGFLDRMLPFAELGRAFVIPRCQKDGATLPLLWQGIGHWLTERPQIKTLMGTVSLSNEWSSYSQHLLLRFLFPKLAFCGEVTARQVVFPWYLQFALSCRCSLMTVLGSRKQTIRASKTNRSWENLIDAMRRNEQKHLPEPILFKYYSSLGGRAFCAGRDAAFTNCLDALFVFDLENMPQKWTKRFLPNHPRFQTQGGFLTGSEKLCNFALKKIEVTDRQAFLFE